MNQQDDHTATPSCRERILACLTGTAVGFLVGFMPIAAFVLYTNLDGFGAAYLYLAALVMGIGSGFAGGRLGIILGTKRGTLVALSKAVGVGILVGLVAALIGAIMSFILRVMNYVSEEIPLDSSEFVEAASEGAKFGFPLGFFAGAIAGAAWLAARKRRQSLSLKSALLRVVMFLAGFITTFAAFAVSSSFNVTGLRGEYRPGGPNPLAGSYENQNMADGVLLLAFVGVVVVATLACWYWRLRQEIIVGAWVALAVLGLGIVLR
jgi:hypothetical protein